MKKTIRKNAKRGQGMTEYIINVALIAIAAIGIITLFGDNIRRLFRPEVLERFREANDWKLLRCRSSCGAGGDLVCECCAGRSREEMPTGERT
jgi:Flp pilus assembly pilin Flp